MWRCPAAKVKLCYNKVSTQGEVAMKDPARKYFSSNVTDRERAIFEGAITLGALYHQFIGAAIHDAKALERAMEQAAIAQPFIEKAEVRIKCSKRKRKHPYIYPELSSEMLKIDLVAKYGKTRVRACLRYIRELDYPLMFIAGSAKR
jgi:hypothetical protein